MNQLVKKISKDRVIVEFLRAMNGILELSNSDMTVLAEIVEEDMKHEVDEDINILSKESKEAMRMRAGCTDNGFKLALRRLSAKRCIIVDKDGRWRVNKSLRPDVIGDKVVQIVFILKFDDK